MFNKITNLIDKELHGNFPVEFSKMMLGYDCWIEQVEENWQLEHIEECYKKFYQNFKLISNNLEAKDDILKTTNKVEKKDTSSNKFIDENSQFYETIVFFEFDKFKLSSNQIVKLEKFIETAINNKNMKIFIEGHTDTMGTKDYNERFQIKEQILSKTIYVRKILITL